MNKKLFLSMLVFTLFGLIFSSSVFAKTMTASNVEELVSSLSDKTVDEVQLLDDIDLDLNKGTIDFNIEGKDRTLDFNGYKLSLTSTLKSIKINFNGSTANTLTFKDSKTNGGIIFSNCTPLNVYSKNNGSTIIFNGGTYESNAGSNYFMINNTENQNNDKNVNCIINKATFYYTRNSPLTTGFDYDIINMEVYGRGQVNPIGFYNDGREKVLKDIVNDDSIIFCAGIMITDNRNTTYARDLYFNSNNATYGIVIQSKSSIKNPITISFSMAAGLEMDPMTVEKGTKLSKIPGPENGGLIVQVWCTDPALKNSFNFNTTAINNDITLYPKWAREYNILAYNYTTLAENSGGKIACSANANNYTNVSGHIFEGNNLTFTAVANTGMKFIKWIDKESGNLYSTEETITARFEDKTPLNLYAVFENVTLLGDINEDGKINADDAADAIEIFKTNQQTPENIAKGDMNSDNKVDAEDAALIIEYFKTHH